MVTNSVASPGPPKAQAAGRVTGSATTRIKDGQRIRVDGGRGVVTILEDEPVLEDA